MINLRNITTLSCIVFIILGIKLNAEPNMGMDKSIEINSYIDNKIDKVNDELKEIHKKIYKDTLTILEYDVNLGKQIGNNTEIRESISQISSNLAKTKTANIKGKTVKIISVKALTGIKRWETNFKKISTDATEALTVLNNAKTNIKSNCKLYSKKLKTLEKNIKNLRRIKDNIKRTSLKEIVNSILTRYDNGQKARLETNERNLKELKNSIIKFVKNIENFFAPLYIVNKSFKSLKEYIDSIQSINPYIKINLNLNIVSFSKTKDTLNKSISEIIRNKESIVEETKSIFANNITNSVFSRIKNNNSWQLNGTYLNTMFESWEKSITLKLQEIIKYNWKSVIQLSTLKIKDNISISAYLSEASCKNKTNPKPLSNKKFIVKNKIGSCIQIKQYRSRKLIYINEIDFKEDNLIFIEYKKKR